MILAALLICFTVISCGSPTNISPTPTTVNEADLSKVKASYEAKLDSYIDLLLTLGVALKEGDDMYVTEQGSSMTQHLMEIAARRDAFNEMNIVSLHYSSPTIELEVPLHKNNEFASMPFEKNGDILSANIPSEEIFGMPTKYGATGTVENTRPLIINGNQVIDGIKLEFKDGKLINYSVKENPEAFEAIINRMPEGVYLGEISMVSSDSPIFQSGKVYYSTLIDENAAAHLAIGSALCDTNLKDGTEIDDDVTVAADHHDIIIGSEKLNVTATLQNGSQVVLMQDGKWASLNK